MMSILSKQKSQRNNHARSKQKRRALRMKNKMKAVHAKRGEKIAKAHKPKIKPFFSTPEIRAKDVAIYQDCGQFYDFKHAISLNQRQKRKRWRQSNQHSKRA